MSRASRGSGFLFWLMFLTGGASLGACLYLPAWLEHQAALEAVSAARIHVAALEQRVRRYDKQIEHLRDDPAYMERLARQQFQLPADDVETIQIEPIPDVSRKDPAAAARPRDELFPHMSAFVEQALARYPVTRIFVLEQTRPIVMVMSAGLVLAAVLLLGSTRRRGPSRVSA